MNQCKHCGGALIGDGYTMPIHCEYAEIDLCVEPDATPIYCDNKEEE